MNRTRKRGERVYRQTAKDVARYLPGSNAPPPLYRIKDGSLAEASPERGVGLSRNLLKSLAAKNGLRRKKAQVVLAHELAHTRQPAAMGMWPKEQGAEAFARRYGKQDLGLTAPLMRPLGDVNAANKARKRGLDWVMKGQFR